jgi:Ca2+-binding RTX toxin-like protein
MATIKGTKKGEKLNGSNFDDVIFGFGGNDTIKGKKGNDKIDGGDGNDVIDGGKGNDKIKGGAGNDTLIGGLGADKLNGGAGDHDVADFGSSAAAVGVDLAAGTGSGGADGDTFTGIEDIVGSSFQDILTGNDGVNKISGGIEADVLSGGGGADVLDGGADGDSIKGGGGADTMTGASGSDNFGYNDYATDALAESGVGAGQRDIITDFTQGVDKISLSNIDSDLLTAGNQEFTFIATAAFGAPSGPNGQVRFDIVGGNTIIQVDRSNDGNFAPDFEIQLTGAVTLTAGDFIL